MTELNAAIRDIALPARLARRPVNDRGFPVPWFVSQINGQWDFVNLDPRKIIEAHRRKLCWLCGQPLGKFLAFVIGPMCSINRVSAEPPSHRECAEYAVCACPFLARPNMRRNINAAVNPSGDNVAGIMIQHNPGVNLIWITTNYRISREGLFEIGEPVSLSWFREGRTASRAEIDAAIDKGLPYLREAATAQDALPELEKQLARARQLLPVE